MENIYCIIVARGIPKGDIHNDVTIRTNLYNDLKAYSKLYDGKGLSSQMTKVQTADVQRLLAKRIENYSYDFDTYNYMDNITGTRADTVEEIQENLRNGLVKQYCDFIQNSTLF